MSNMFNKLKNRAEASPSVSSKIWEDPRYFFVFGFGSGTMPIAPGTFGTLMAVPFYLALSLLPLWLYLLFIVLFIAVSAWLSDQISHEIGFHDHPGMCIDEFAGFFVTMILAPVGIGWIILGFLLFRFFDIIKPWPIRLLDEKVHGGFGMILDDVVAGLFAMMVLQLTSVILN
jgi:phosphatidylglycerophosphatase A